MPSHLATRRAIVAVERPDGLEIVRSNVLLPVSSGEHRAALSASRQKAWRSCTVLQTDKKVQGVVLVLLHNLLCSTR